MVKAIFDAYFKEYRLKYDISPSISEQGKFAGKAKQLEKYCISQDVQESELVEIIKFFFRSEDKMILESVHSFDFFHSQFSKFLVKYRQWKKSKQTPQIPKIVKENIEDEREKMKLRNQEFRQKLSQKTDEEIKKELLEQGLEIVKTWSKFPAMLRALPEDYKQRVFTIAKEIWGKEAIQNAWLGQPMAKIELKKDFVISDEKVQENEKRKQELLKQIQQLKGNNE